jgi:hypothetical protein
MNWPRPVQLLSQEHVEEAFAFVKGLNVVKLSYDQTYDWRLVESYKDEIFLLRLLNSILLNKRA